jgi:hypothetical protein
VRGALRLDPPEVEELGPLKVSVHCW